MSVGSIRFLRSNFDPDEGVGRGRRYGDINRAVAYMCCDIMMSPNVGGQTNLRPQLFGEDCPTWKGGDKEGQPREYIYEDDIDFVKTRISLSGKRVTRLAYFSEARHGRVRSVHLKVPQSLRRSRVKPFSDDPLKDSLYLHWLGRYTLTAGVYDDVVMTPAAPLKAWSARTWTIYLQALANEKC
jgi:hypothetical protein